MEGQNGARKKKVQNTNLLLTGLACQRKGYKSGLIIARKPIKAHLLFFPKNCSHQKSNISESKIEW